MKKVIGIKLICFFALMLAGFSTGVNAQTKEVPWKAEQLVAPETLAGQLKLPAADRPAIIDVGPAGTIKYALGVGPAGEDEGLSKLKTLLKSLPKNKEVIIYCGCCPFAHCPNVRPAFKMLLDMGFLKPRLLNLSHNLKTDWIDKGYPLADQ